jgi:poly-gamma-glutamate capsule biosynthesis protein CapA/YwtB (metallophosphatase superfamily)
MATEIDLFSLSMEASADLSAAQFLCIGQAADAQAEVAGAGEKIIGVLQNKPAAEGRAATVRVHGTTKVVVGATLAIDDILMVDAAGKVIPATAGNFGVGIALETGANADEIITMLLKDITVET